MNYHKPVSFVSSCTKTLQVKLLNYPQLLKELTHIAKIFNICAEKVKDHPEYASILSEALKICGYESHVFSFSLLVTRCEYHSIDLLPSQTSLPEGESV